MVDNSLSICGGPEADVLGRASVKVESWKNVWFRVVGGVLQYDKSKVLLFHLHRVKQRNPCRYPSGEWDCEGTVVSGEFQANGVNLEPGTKVRIWYVDSRHIGGIYLSS